jgi:ankyrin repeat protein
MKHLLITTIAAVVLVGCGPSISIHMAAFTGNIEAIKQHLAAGTDVNAKDAVGNTPLIVAAGNGYNEIAELLIAEGADVNAKGYTDWTSLHHTAIQGYKEISELLIDNGADVNAKDEDGKTPLDDADGETADLLRKHGGKSGAEDSIHVAVAVGNIKAVKQHLDAGTDVNAKDGVETPLHSAASVGHKEIAELLIAAGADLNAKNDILGGTPLHWTETEEIAELLIAKGADVNARDDGGLTPLDWTITFNHTETADLLRKHGGKTGEELKAEGK